MNGGGYPGIIGPRDTNFSLATLKASSIPDSIITCEGLEVSQPNSSGDAEALEGPSRAAAAAANCSAFVFLPPHSPWPCTNLNSSQYAGLSCSDLPTRVSHLQSTAFALLRPRMSASQRYFSQIASASLLVILPHGHSSLTVAIGPWEGGPNSEGCRRWPPPPSTSAAMLAPLPAWGQTAAEARRSRCASRSLGSQRVGTHTHWRGMLERNLPGPRNVRLALYVSGPSQHNSENAMSAGEEARPSPMLRATFFDCFLAHVHDVFPLPCFVNLFRVRASLTHTQSQVLWKERHHKSTFQEHARDDACNLIHAQVHGKTSRLPSSAPGHALSVHLRDCENMD